MAAVAARKRRPGGGPARLVRAGEVVSATWQIALAGLALAGGIALYVQFVRPQLGKPFIYDEAAFAFVGEGVAATGLPYANLGHIGRDGQWGIHGTIDERFDWGLWHPPLYVYALGLSFQLLGVNESSARLVGVICNLGAALFVFLSARSVLRDDATAPERLLWPAVAALVYLANPLVIQSALLLDIDGTVLVLLLAVLLYLSLQLAQAKRHREWLSWCGVAVVVFALALWAKMTSPWAVPVALLLYRLLARRPRQWWRGLVEFAAVVAGGTTVFVASWWLASRLTGMPFGMPFHVLWVEFLDAAGSSGAWRSQPALLAELVAYVALWVSPYLVALLVWAALRRARELLAGRPWLLVQPVDIALIAGGGLALLYLLKLAASFPKYHIAMMPMWAVAVGWLLARSVGRLGVVESLVYAVALAGFGTYFVTRVNDQWVVFRDWSFLEPLVVVPAALGLGFLALGPLLRRNSIERQGMLLLLCLLLAWSYGVNGQQARSGGSTAYYYAVSGTLEAAKALDETVRDGEPYVAAKELAWYSRNKLYLDQDLFAAVLHDFDARELLWDGTMMGTPIRVVALFIWDITVREWYGRHLEPRYELVHLEGVYYVFVDRESVG